MCYVCPRSPLYYITIAAANYVVAYRLFHFIYCIYMFILCILKDFPVGNDNNNNNNIIIRLT